jgi:DNA-binding MarR family transcriptional regulator
VRKQQCVTFRAVAQTANSDPRAGTPLALTSPGFKAWRALIVSNSRLLRELDAEMQTGFDFTLGEFDVLATLANAPDHRLRMCDLAEAVVLSASGLSRRVDRLERSGRVNRERSDEDGRSVEAVLTPEGKRWFKRASDHHLAGVRRLFAEHFSDGELETLAALLGRLQNDGPQ